MKLGFHTRLDLKKALTRPKAAAPLESIEALGHDAVAHLNRRARTPNMQPRGPQDCDVYAVGPCPDKEEDEDGQPWKTSRAKPFIQALRGLAVRWGYVSRTATKDGGPPTANEILAYRSALRADIVRSKPAVILACGHIAFQAFQDNLQPNLKGNIELHRGRAFPLDVDGHLTWLVVTVSPEQYEDWTQNGNKTCRDADEWELHLGKDLELAAEAVDWPEPKVWPADADRLLASLECRLTYDAESSIASLRKFRDSLTAAHQIALDWETFGLRPYKESAAVRTVALRSRSTVIAFPIDHPSCVYTKAQREELLDLLWDVLDARVVITHHLEFEDEWAVFLLGVDAARLARWQCTLAQGYVLGARAVKAKANRGDQNEDQVVGLSLDYICRLHLGLPLKSCSPKDSWQDGTPLGQTLKYNALDALATFEIYFKQGVQLSKLRLREAYQDQVRTIPTVVLAQHGGLPVSQKRRAELQDRFEREMDEALALLSDTPEVTEYEKLYGDFSPQRDKDITKLFREFLDIDVVRCDADSLLKYKDISYVSRGIVDYKKAHKLLSTYVLPFSPDHPKSVIWDDGLVHCQINTCKTSTTRTSAEFPNVQNWPKRNEVAKVVREIVEAPPGWVFVALDYAQIEARVLAMAARDSVFCEMVRSGYDIHGAWARRWAQLSGYKGDMDALRSLMKNGFVFPLFFGAGLKRIASVLKGEEDLVAIAIDEFKDTFKESFEWQKKILSGYDRNGYVETLTGHRRYGPLTYNMKINLPIQGTTARLVIDAWNRVSEHAEAVRKSYLAPKIMIHDDLTFMFPEKDLERNIKNTARIMVDMPFDFINVPIGVEAEVGRNLGKMKKYAKYTSDDFGITYN